MDISKIPRKIPNYNQLFEILPKKKFLNSIFISPRFVKTYAFFWSADFNNKIKMLNQVFTYYDEDDLYQYFKINHSLHKDKSKYDYILTLFHLITDLHKYSSPNVFIDNNNEYCDPIYIYQQSPNVTPEKYNIVRDLIYYGYSAKDVRIKFGYNPKNFKKILKELYQEELLPLDITLV